MLADNVSATAVPTVANVRWSSSVIEAAVKRDVLLMMIAIPVTIVMLRMLLVRLIFVQTLMLTAPFKSIAIRLQESVLQRSVIFAENVKAMPIVVVVEMFVLALVLSENSVVYSVKESQIVRVVMSATKRPVKRVSVQNNV